MLARIAVVQETSTKRRIDAGSAKSFFCIEGVRLPLSKPSFASLTSRLNQCFHTNIDQKQIERIPTKFTFVEASYSDELHRRPRLTYYVV